MKTYYYHEYSAKGWDERTKLLDSRYNPEFYKKHFKYEIANKQQLRKLIQVIFVSKFIIGIDD